ncbi:Trp biosynthesis-associated membrane protein [Nocardioides terrisoli]|uniref:Trp biosynthesis-associated membrane protein n=1 Tax=Nocardioides terrisoli TaxID=3388267 RepID=UPI00287BB347|nr:Trp biosynthesis-associated membrane protein [Nocardioides marmorisolisilvae]
MAEPGSGPGAAPEPTSAGRGRDPRRTFAPVLLPGAAAAALAAVAGAKVWARLDSSADSVSAGLPIDRGVLDAAGQVPLASALSLACLAAWGAILVTRGRFRRVVAAVGLVCAVALLAVTVRSAWSAPDAVRRAVDTQLGLGSPGTGTAAVSLTGWFWVCLVAALVTSVALALAIRFARSWPAMGAKYDAPGAAAQRAAEAEPKTNLEIWKAIDEGRDPTE